MPRRRPGRRRGRRVPHCQRRGQGALQGVEDELVDATCIAEAHFGLGRVHVDVDAGGVEFEKQHIGRVARAVQDVGPGLARGVGQQLVAHEAAIDEEILLVAPGARIGRQRGKARQAQRAGGFIQRPRLGEEVVADDFAGAPLKVMRSGIPWDGAGETAFLAAVVAEAEGDVGPRQRHAPQHLVAMGVFGGVGLEKLAPCRGVEVEVGDLDHRAAVERGGFNAAALAAQAIGVGLRGLPAGDRNAGHGGDRGQGLAAKAEAGDAFQVVKAGYLARGMARQGQRQVVGGNAAAVIGDTDQAYAAFFELHVDLRGAGVEAVFQQFLEHRGRALHHLAGGDLADQQVGQWFDGPHRWDYRRDMGP